MYMYKHVNNCGRTLSLFLAHALGVRSNTVKFSVKYKKIRKIFAIYAVGAHKLTIF